MNCTQLSLGHQIEWLRKQFTQSDALAFSEVFPRELILDVFADLGVRFHNLLYNSVTTVRLFLSQVISADPSLATTVERFLALRLDQQLPACDSNTGAYSHTRSRLPEDLLSKLVRHTGTVLEVAAPLKWLWRGRHVKLFDGSTVLIPEPARTKPPILNRAARTRALAFRPPRRIWRLARIGVLFSFLVGSVLARRRASSAGNFKASWVCCG